MYFVKIEAPKSLELLFFGFRKRFACILCILKFWFCVVIRLARLENLIIESSFVSFFFCLNHFFILPVVM